MGGRRKTEMDGKQKTEGMERRNGRKIEGRKTGENGGEKKEA